MLSSQHRSRNRGRGRLSPPTIFAKLDKTFYFLFFPPLFFFWLLKYSNKSSPPPFKLQQFITILFNTFNLCKNRNVQYSYMANTLSLSMFTFLLNVYIPHTHSLMKHITQTKFGYFWYIKEFIAIKIIKIIISLYNYLHCHWDVHFVDM